MAKVLNYTKYHKINEADHRHHRQQQQQQQQIELLLLIKQQKKQRQENQTTANQSNNDNNNKHSHFNKNKNNSYNEFINCTTAALQQHVANDQQSHYPISNANFQQLTSVSSFSIMKNRNSKINNLSNVNNKNTFLASLAAPPQQPSILPPSTACSYSASPHTPPTEAVNPSCLTPPLAPSHLNISSTYSTYYSTCCVLTYNMFTAYAEAATLQLKRKTQFNKLLHVSGHPDMRSICYLILMAFFYWSVMIRAAVATNLTTTQAPTSASHMEELNTKDMFYSNITINQSNANGNCSDVNGQAEGSDVPPIPQLLANSSLNLPISVLSSNDTLTNYQRRLLMRREAANVPDFDDDDSSYRDDELDEYEILINNKSGKYSLSNIICTLININY